MDLHLLEGEEMKKQMTPWFPSNIKPVRAGVYQTNYAGSTYTYFDGKRWSWSNPTLKSANKDRDTHGAYQQKEWRGFTEEQK
jgi:hypothetical protein